MLKEIVTAIQSYARAHRFIREHRLWKWIIVPGIIYTLLFIAGFILFWNSSNQVVSSFMHWLGIDRWINQQRNPILSFLLMMGEIMVRLIMMLFYFSLFKYLFLIIGSPVFAYLSEKTESIMEGKDFPFSFKQLLADILRGIKLALRNALWQSVYTISLLILSFIPVVGWIVPVTTAAGGMLLLRLFDARLQLRTPQAVARRKHSVYWQTQRAGHWKWHGVLPDASGSFYWLGVGSGLCGCSGYN